MTLEQTLDDLRALGTEKMRAQNTKNGAGENQFGVRRGDIRKVAKKLKKNPELAPALWDTGNVDARMVAILIMNPKKVSVDEIDRLVRSESFVEVVDWLTSYVVKKHPDKEKLRQNWMTDEHPMAARVGWALTAERIVKSADGLDLPKILDRLETEMGNADPKIQWTMNFALAQTGIQHAEYRERAIAIGERLGIYRDYPTSKGCTSPFAPIWIDAMVARQEAPH